MSLKLLSLDDVKQSISMVQAIEAMENAFLQLATQQAELPLRASIPIPKEHALTLTMPAYLAQNHTLGLKVVSIFPKNLAQNKPAITGFIMLLDATTGEPKVLMEASFLTAIRTGAISGLATKYFAREDACHVAIIGSGVQAYTQLEAVAAVRPITHVSIWSRNQNNAQEFADKIKHRYTVKVHPSINEVIKQADIICTATGSTAPLITEVSALKPYAHINAVGSHSRSMQEIGSRVLSQAVVVVDQLEAVLHEAGEIIHAVEQQALKKEVILEIGQWLLHKKDHRDTLTVFKSVGLAIQDLSVAEVVYQNALSKDLGLAFSLN